VKIDTRQKQKQKKQEATRRDGIRRLGESEEGEPYCEGGGVKCGSLFEKRATLELEERHFLSFFICNIDIASALS